MCSLARPLLLIAAACIGLVVMLGGCANRPTSDRDLSYVNPQRGAELARGEAGLLPIGAKTGTWLDPRTARAYATAHIPGAMHLPFQDVTSEYRRLKVYDVVVVYGDGYDDVKAQAMSKRLMELGVAEVHVLRGGLQAWREAGMPLEDGDGNAVE